jgi:hypothetical protein
MLNGRLPDGASPIEGVSPTDSIDTLVPEFGSPSEKLLIRSPHSVQSLRAKPWPARPQHLHKSIRGWRWWDSAHDAVAIMLPAPFFALAAVVAAVNGKVFDEQEFVILDRCIKGVRDPTTISKWSSTNSYRLPLSFQFALQPSLAEQ